MAQPLIPKQYFDGVGADKQLKFDPTGHTLPTFTVGKVYALDGSGDVILATATSSLILGIYSGANDEGLPIFEQLYYTEAAAFTARGTRWYLDAAGALTTTANDSLFGIGIDADTLLIVWHGIDTGGATPGVDYSENSAGTISDVTAMDFLSDVAGGKPFADLSGTTPNAALEIDKQIDYIGLAGSGAAAVTGFSFVAATYRSCQLYYSIENGLGHYETGIIHILHDGTNAAVRVDKLDSAAAAIGGTAPDVTFSADISGGNVRLLYTEANADDFNLSVKPRAMVASQTVTVEFTLASSNVLADTPSTHTWTAEITTSDGQPLVAGVSVDVIDDGTGSADGSDYTMTTPQTLTWAVSAPSGETQDATLSVLGNDEDDDVDTSLTNPVGCSLGAQTTHQINLQAAGA